MSDGLLRRQRGRGEGREGAGGGCDSLARSPVSPPWGEDDVGGSLRPQSMLSSSIDVSLALFLSEIVSEPHMSVHEQVAIQFGVPLMPLVRPCVSWCCACHVFVSLPHPPGYYSVVHSFLVYVCCFGASQCLCLVLIAVQEATIVKWAHKGGGVLLER